NTPLKMILTWFLPLGWVAAIPQSTVINDGRWYFAILVVGISVAFFTLVYQLWRLFLVKYQSSGT
ncbi:MAG: ABC-2 family transporter protein, partial [Lacticaseibacillus paracasei]|nr:ABC-2 family transporter protein [Lacticaseibacillus paracasei]